MPKKSVQVPILSHIYSVPIFDTLFDEFRRVKVGSQHDHPAQKPFVIVEGHSESTEQVGAEQLPRTDSYVIPICQFE